MILSQTLPLPPYHMLHLFHQLNLCTTPLLHVCIDNIVSIINMHLISQLIFFVHILLLQLCSLTNILPFFYLQILSHLHSTTFIIILFSFLFPFYSPLTYREMKTHFYQVNLTLQSHYSSTLPPILSHTLPCYPCSLR